MKVFATLATLWLSAMQAPLAAAPISYTFTGTGTGTAAGTPFTNSAFTVSITGNTSDVAFQPSLAALGIINIPGATMSIAGVGTVNFASVFVYRTGPEVGFGTDRNLVSIQNGAVSGYGLVTSFGPASSANSSLSQFVNIPTNLGILTYSSMSTVTFQASVSGVPEPASGGMLLIGAGLLGLCQNRWKPGRDGSRSR